jgi:hypothetical protein
MVIHTDKLATVIVVAAEQCSLPFSGSLFVKGGGEEEEVEESIAGEAAKKAVDFIVLFMVICGDIAVAVAVAKWDKFGEIVEEGENNDPLTVSLEALVKFAADPCSLWRSVAIFYSKLQKKTSSCQQTKNLSRIGFLSAEHSQWLHSWVSPLVLRAKS